MRAYSKRKLKSEQMVLTVPEVAQKLGIGLTQAYAAVRYGAIPAIRLGKRWVVPIERFNQFLNGEEKVV